MLATKAYRITTSQAGVHQNVKPDPLPRPNWPARFEGRYVVLGPNLEALGPWSWQIGDAGSWIRIRYSGRHRPAKQAAHGVEEMSCLKWSDSAAIAAGDNSSLSNLADRLTA